MSFRLARLSDRDMRSNKDENDEKENVDADIDDDLQFGSPPSRATLSKTGSGPLLYPTSEAKKARRSFTVKERHESKSTNDINANDAKSKHSLLVQTKAECVAELALFLPTLSATADSLASAELQRYHEVNKGKLFLFLKILSNGPFFEFF
jgi:hypothetical protein